MTPSIWSYSCSHFRLVVIGNPIKNGLSALLPADDRIPVVIHISLCIAKFAVTVGRTCRAIMPFNADVDKYPT